MFLFSVTQVLPDGMIVLAEPVPSDMVQAVKKAIDILPNIDPQAMHLRVSESSHLELSVPIFAS